MIVGNEEEKENDAKNVDKKCLLLICIRIEAECLLRHQLNLSIESGRSYLNCIELKLFDSSRF